MVGMRKRLIVNADDFGQTSGINRGIAECAGHGILTSSTLMASGVAFAEAVRISRTSSFGVGCHVVLVDGAPISDSKSLPTLTRDGYFRKSIFQLASGAMLDRISAPEVEHEAYAQIQRLQEAGVQVTHIDTHKHAHMFPNILRPLLRAAKRAGVTRVRNPFEPAWTLKMSLTRANLVRSLEVTLLRGLASTFHRTCREEGFATTEGALGVIATGSLDESVLCRLLDRIPDGTWELVTHPGYNDEELRAQKTRLVASRDTERAALISATAREAIARNGIELISFAQL